MIYILIVLSQREPNNYEVFEKNKNADFDKRCLRLSLCKVL